MDSIRLQCLPRARRGVSVAAIGIFKGLLGSLSDLPISVPIPKTIKS